jgi:hypothetical protein
MGRSDMSLRNSMKFRFWDIAIVSLVVLAVSNALLFFFYTYNSIIVTPYGDTLDWISRFFSVGHDNIFEFLWATHNEHRPVFIKLLVAMDLVLFDGATIPIVSILICILCLIAISIFAAIWRSNRDSGLAIFYISIVSIILFSNINIPNYAYSVNGSFVGVLAFSLLSFHALSFLATIKPRANLFKILIVSLAILCGMCAMASSTNGLLVWPVLLLLGLRIKVDKPVLASILIAGTTTAWVFVDSPSSNEGATTLVASTGDIVSIFMYLVEFNGMPWVAVTPLYWPAFVLGAAILVLQLLALSEPLLKTRTSRIDLIAWSMLLFAFGTAILISIGRFDLSLPPAHRYGIFMTATKISLVILAIPYINKLIEKRSMQPWVLLGICLIALGLVAQQIPMGRFGIARAQAFEKLEAQILEGRNFPEDTTPIYPDPDILEAHYRMMQTHNIYMFK